MVEDAKGLSEIAEEVQNEESVESSTTDKDSSQEVQAETESPDEMDTELDNDEEFQKSKDDLEKELGKKLTFGQTKRFKQLYWEGKQSKRDLSNTKEELDSLREELDSLKNQDTDISEGELLDLAKKHGFELSKSKQDKDINDLQSMLDKIEDTSQRNWWKNYTQTLEDKIVKSIAEKFGTSLNAAATMAVDYRLEQSEKKARSLIESVNKKTGLNIDFDKDVDPALAKMLKTNRNIDVNKIDMLTLTREWLADNGIELGKKVSERQQRETVTNLKKANVESDIKAKSSPVDDSGKSFREIMRDVMRNETA